MRQAPPARAVAAVPGKHVGNAPANNGASAAPYEARQPQPARQAEQPQAPAATRYSEQSRQATPPEHGAPPNLREGNNGGQETNGHLAERTQPEVNSTRDRSEAQPRAQQQSYPERNQPQPARQAEQQREPQVHPARPRYPEPGKNPEEARPRSETPAKTEAKPAEREEHGRAPEHKDTKDTKDHQK